MQKSRALAVVRIVASTLPLVGLCIASARAPSDSDVDRFLAYSNATLGRAYDPYYVAAANDWQRAFDEAALASCDNCARAWITPPRPLTPYRDFVVEYPPGFFLATLPPALIAITPPAYRAAFAAWMALCLAVAVLAACRVAERAGYRLGFAQVMWWTGVAAIALGKVSVQRYDAMIGMLIAAMAWVTVAGVPVATGVLAGTLFEAKLVPALAAAVCLLALARTRVRDAAIALAASVLTIAVLTAPFVAGLPNMSAVVRFHANRPPEFESIAAAVAGLLSAASFSRASAVVSYGSMNIVGPMASRLSVVCSIAGAIAIAVVFVRTWQTLRTASSTPARSRTLIAAIVVVLAVFVTTAKVSSLQFLLWLVPIALIVPLGTGDTLALAAFYSALVARIIVYRAGLPAVASVRAWPFVVSLGAHVLLLAAAMRILKRSKKTP